MSATHIYKTYAKHTIPFSFHFSLFRFPFSPFSLFCYLCHDIAPNSSCGVWREVCNREIMFVELLKILFGGLCVGLASSVTVGPVAVLCIQRTLSKGHLSGFISSMGVVCADTIMAILAFSVYALMKSYIDEYSSIIQLVGGVFVVIVGVFIFFKNPVPQIRKNKTSQSALWQDFGSMFGFTLANFVVVIPYILAFFTMFNIELTIDVHSGITGAFALSDAIYNILVLGGFFFGATLWWLGVTSIISIFHKGFKPRHMIVINRVAGLVIMVLGVATLLSVIIE